MHISVRTKWQFTLIFLLKSLHPTIFNIVRCFLEHQWVFAQSNYECKIKTKLNQKQNVIMLALCWSILKSLFGLMQTHWQCQLEMHIYLHSSGNERNLHLLIMEVSCSSILHCMFMPVSVYTITTANPLWRSCYN